MRRVRTHARRASVALLVCAVSVAVSACANGCQDDSSNPYGGAPGASASARAGNASPPASASGRPPPPALQMCQAVSVSGAPKVSFFPGSAGDGGAPTTIVESGDIPDLAWVSFEAGGKLTARHPHSTREASFTGPGRVRPCVGRGGRDEEAWVESGKFESEPSAGERPGAEEWVVTPAGVIRYGGGRIELTVGSAAPASGAKVDVKVSSGSAFAWTEDEAGPVRVLAVAPTASSAPSAGPAASSSAAAAARSGDPVVSDRWIRLDGARAITLSVKRPGKPEDLAATALDRCKVEAQATKSLAITVASPDASLSQVAPRHVVARRIARAACAVAALRVDLLEPSSARDGMSAALKEAESDWKMSRPRGPHGRFH